VADDGASGGPAIPGSATVFIDSDFATEAAVVSGAATLPALFSCIGVAVRTRLLRGRAVTAAWFSTGFGRASSGFLSGAGAGPRFETTAGPGCGSIGFVRFASTSEATGSESFDAGAGTTVALVLIGSEESSAVLGASAFGFSIVLGASIFGGAEGSFALASSTSGVAAGGSLGAAFSDCVEDVLPAAIGGFISAGTAGAATSRGALAESELFAISFDFVAAFCSTTRLGRSGTATVGIASAAAGVAASG
jgi:hypothetical protein